MRQIHVKNVKLKQYIPCKRFVEHLVGVEQQWATGRYSLEEWRARGAAGLEGSRQIARVIPPMNSTRPPTAVRRPQGVRQNVARYVLLQLHIFLHEFDACCL